MTAIADRFLPVGRCAIIGTRLAYDYLASSSAAPRWVTQSGSQSAKRGYKHTKSLLLIRRRIMFRRIFVLAVVLNVLMVLYAFTLVRAQDQTAVLSDALSAHIAQLYTDDMWNKRDMVAGDTLLSDDFVDHAPIPDQHPGREG